MAHCLIYKHRGKFYVVSQIKTDNYWRLASPPVSVISRDEPPATLGDAVLTSLSHYREDVPHPSDLSDDNDPVRHALKLKSWDDLSSLHAELCNVARDGDFVTITPTTGDENGGYTPDPDRARRCGVDAREIGDAARSMFGVRPST